MASSSPGSTSRTNDAPTMSSAAVSLATTQPRSSRPSTSGRTPCGSRAAYRVCSSQKTSENAPAQRGQQPHRGLLDADVGGRGGEQLGDEVGVGARAHAAAVAERRATSSRSSAVLTRLPLWPSAMPLPAAVVRKVGWAFSQVVDPVVE